MASPKIYTRLAGPRGRLASYHSLYLGPDHLLSVISQGFEERYRRFPLADIQAMGATRTQGGTVGLAADGLIALLFALAAFETDGGLSIFLWVMAAPFALAIPILLWLGPTCTFYVQTSVQRTRLPAVKRFRKALAVMERVGGLVEAGQGRLNTASMPLEALEALGPREAITSRAESRQDQDPVRSGKGGWHLALFYTLLADAVVAAASFTLPQVLWNYLETILFLVLAGLMVTALVKQTKSGLSRDVRVITGVTGVYLVSLFFLSQILAFVLQVSQPGQIMGQAKIAVYLAPLSPQEMGAFFWLYLFEMTGSLLLGGMGLIRTVRSRAAARA